MLKIGERVTVEEFIKFAPYGLILCHEVQRNHILYYNLKEFKQCTNAMKRASEHDMSPVARFYKPGYMWSSGIDIIAPAMGAWRYIDSDWIVKTLPTKQIRLKRKKHV